MKTAMASWPAGRANRGNNRFELPPVQQKSKIPVRMTQLSRDSDNSSSSEDEGLCGQVSAIKNSRLSLC